MTKESLQLNVLISEGFAGAYEQLLPEFQRMSGIKVTTGSGASQGSGPETIAAQLGRGVIADVVILSGEGLNELIAVLNRPSHQQSHPRAWRRMCHSADERSLRR